MSGSGEKRGLIDRIRAEAGETGVPFRRFMEMCLYDSGDGFYAGPGAAVGREGHFLTSVTVSRLFGHMLAQQILEVWLRLGRPEPFALIEQGAHGGRLALDVLGWCRDFAPGLFRASRYRVVEPFAHWRARQSAALGAAGFGERLEHFASLRDLAAAPMAGVVFCNELLDAFPVPRVRFDGGAWREMRAGWRGERFEWVEGPAVSGDLAAMVARLPLPPIAGYSTEIHDGLRRWLREASGALAQGAVFAFDYGFPEGGYYDPARRDGTIRAYRRHRLSNDVLADPGEQDITAHVNWTELVAAAPDAGLESLGIADQHHFAVGLLEGDLRRLEGSGATAGLAAAFRAIAHPEGMGRQFAVAGFRKGLARGDPLGGFRFARFFV